jgi:hypothetical protein
VLRGDGSRVQRCRVKVPRRVRALRSPGGGGSRLPSGMSVQLRRLYDRSGVQVGWSVQPPATRFRNRAGSRPRGARRSTSSMAGSGVALNIECHSAAPISRRGQT